MEYIAVPKNDYYALKENWEQIPGILFKENDSLYGVADYPYFKADCAAVQDYFNTISVVITRDKYDVPKETYLVNTGNSCFVNIAKVDD